MFNKFSSLFVKFCPFIICIVLFSLPFFWLKSGEMDLGGDDNRLFFYSPIEYIKNSSTNTVIRTGRGSIQPRYYDIPYVGFLALLKVVFSSPTTLIAIINGMKVTGGFLGVFLIVSELMMLEGNYTSTKRKNISVSAILAGIFYIVSFGSYRMAIFWDRALTSHNQIFLNPILFYLLLKYLLTRNFIFVCVSLFITFVFAPNFSLSAVPPFFAFYPLALLFLFLYVKIIVKKSIPWGGLFVGGVLFLGVQAFHLLGQIVSMFDKNSYITNRVFDKTAIEQGGVFYFTAVRGLAKAVYNIFLPSAVRQLQWTSFVAPLIVVVGLLINKKRKAFLLVILFFVITFFLVTANITDIGFQFYRSLFYIPGFSIFRNFYTQWLFVFIFFYSILFGYSISEIILTLRSSYVRIFLIPLCIFLIITGLPLFSGEVVSKNIIRGSNNIKSSFVFDSQYTQTLQFIRNLPNDGKIVVLPLTDYYLQVISGKDGMGAYEGPSTLRYLTEKYSFVGYQDFGYLDSDPAPYAEEIMKYSRELNYERLLRIFTTLNIRYILYNSDPEAYEKGFFPGPFGYMMTSLPKTQEVYKEYLSHFPLTLIYSTGPYSIYKINKSSYNSTIFIPDGVYQGSQLSFDEDKAHDIFINPDTCTMPRIKYICEGGYRKSNERISFTMINPSLYEVAVNNYNPSDSLFVVMSNIYHKEWKLLVDGKPVAEQTHIPVNGYANGWFIDPGEVPGTSSGSFIFQIRLDSQKYFNYGIMISGVSLFLLAVCILRYFYNRK